VLVTCASGGRSLLAAEILQRMGYRDVASMSGGFVDWAKLGQPVEKG
jgi:rhodanese-related sulfurtransferase